MKQDRAAARKAAVKRAAALCVPALALAGLALADLWVCPFRAVTGVPCPCCGITRAWQALLQGRVGQAFSLHPLFWALPPVVVWLVVRSARPGAKPLRPWAAAALYGFLAVFFAVWLLRAFVWHVAA